MGIGGELGEKSEDQIDATRTLGWSNIELRDVKVKGYPKANVHDIEPQAFYTLCEHLKAAGIHVYCLGSSIMNWAKTIRSPFWDTEAETARAITRMGMLDTKFVRIMSYKPGDEEYSIPAIVFEHVREITKRFLEAGMTPVHENCMNYGGMSYKHTLELLEKCPGLKLVFDTGNPVFNPDRSKSKPWPRQSAWEFWTNVRDHVAHIHIKDAVWNPEKEKPTYTWPSEGEGDVRRILKDALKLGYDGGISIEPHMAAVFHEKKSKKSAPTVDAKENFIEYGRRLKRIITELRDEVITTRGGER